MKMWIRERLAWIVVPATVGLGVATPASAARLQGTVTDAETGAPLPAANIVIVDSDGLGTSTRSDGTYRLEVPAGTHTVRVEFLGYEADESTVRVFGAITRHDVKLKPTSVFLDPIVVSASRYAEKITEAPAAVTVINAAEMETREGATAAEHISTVMGVDYTKSGLDTYQINARGMNSTFPRRMLVMTDNRSILLPGIGIVRWSMLSAASTDIERMEVVTGPASALYGNAALSGTVLIQTKSPLDHQGVSAVIAGGERATMKATARLSHLLSDDVGFKVSFERFSGKEWPYVDETSTWYASVSEPTRDNPLTVLNTDGTPRTVVTGPDFDIDDSRVDGRLDWRTSDTGRISLYGGWTRTNSITLTGLGRYQIKNWQAYYGQAAYRDDHFFLQAYVTGNDAGQTFSLGSGLPIVDNSVGYDVEAQNNFRLGERVRVIWGGNYRQLTNDTEGTIIAEKKTFDLFGGYAQTEIELASTLDLIGAIRVDTHPRTDTQVSPKAGLVWKPAGNHTFRATYNRAFQNPIFTEFFLDLPLGSLPAVDRQGHVILVPDPETGEVGPVLVPAYATGNPDIKPEQITTFEFGYQGLLGGKLLTSVDVHRSTYDDFISDLLPFAGPMTELPQIDVTGDGNPDPLPGNPRLDDAGNVVGYDFIGYTNFGGIDVTGFDVGLTYLATRNFQFGGTYSYLTSTDVETIDHPERFAPDPSTGVLIPDPLNAPKHKFTLNTLYRGENGWTGSVNFRWVDDFEWSAGIYAGHVESYGVLDASLGYRINESVELSVVGTNVLDNRHVELIGAPEIGRQILGRISVDI